MITVEEHQVHAGLGGAVAEALALHGPPPVEMVGMPDSFGESGRARLEELLEHCCRSSQADEPCSGLRT